MTKAELIENVHGRATEGGNSLTKKQTGELVDIVFNVLGEAIRKDDRFTYPGFGTFTVKERKAREGRNPRTGDPIQIPASKTVSFKPAPKFKDSLGPAAGGKKATKKKATKKKAAKKKTAKKK